MDLRLVLAILLGKSTAFLNKIRGTGATAAPGLVGLKIDPQLVAKITKANNLKSIIVSGTNGKTTTSRLIFDLISRKYKVIHNRQGSNLLRGVASSLISSISLTGKTTTNLCLWEADEASLTSIIEQSDPKVVVLLNLFRDQLDRYGEIDTTRKKWQKVVESLNKNTTLVINSDDPNINFLAKSTKAQKLFFGIDVSNINLPSLENIADVKFCPNCTHKLAYQKLYSAHLGVYKCTNCNFKRTSPNTKAISVNFKKDFTTEIEIAASTIIKTTYPLPGLFNVYNILAAISAIKPFNLSNKIIKEKIQNFSSAFGRFQKIRKDEIEIITFLIKNPAGTNEVLRTIHGSSPLNLLVILNDNIADGRDVSWIWDTNWESLNDKVANLFISGTRAYDLALRFKYANFKIAGSNINPDVQKSIDSALKNLKSGSTLFILPTYTALLSVQKNLTKGDTQWQNQ